jgi:hypothetical protein
VYCPLLLPHRCQFVSSKKKSRLSHHSTPVCVCLGASLPLENRRGDREEVTFPDSQSMKKNEVFLLHTRASVVLALVIMIIIKIRESRSELTRSTRDGARVQENFFCLLPPSPLQPRAPKAAFHSPFRSSAIDFFPLGLLSLSPPQTHTRSAK